MPSSSQPSRAVRSSSTAGPVRAGPADRGRRADAQRAVAGAEQRLAESVDRADDLGAERKLPLSAHQLGARVGVDLLAARGGRRRGRRGGRRRSTGARRRPRRAGSSGPAAPRSAAAGGGWCPGTRRPAGGGSGRGRPGRSRRARAGGRRGAGGPRSRSRRGVPWPPRRRRCRGAAARRGGRRRRRPRPPRRCWRSRRPGLRGRRQRFGGAAGAERFQLVQRRRRAGLGQARERLLEDGAFAVALLQLFEAFAAPPRSRGRSPRRGRRRGGSGSAGSATPRLRSSSWTRDDHAAQASRS